MRKFIFTISLTLLSLTAFSQTDTIAIKELQEQVLQLQTELITQKGKLQAELKNQKADFSTKIELVKNDIAKTQEDVDKEKETVLALNDSLKTQLNSVRISAEQQIASVDKSLNKTTSWVIIGLLFAVIVSGVLYLLLRKKQQSDRTDLISQLSDTKQSIDEKLVNEFAKNTEALEVLSQLSKSTQSVEPDHSLALKVASEINLIERNINLMDSKTKGLKQLSRSVEKLKDNLAANGYEIPQLLGKEFNQGMKIIVSSSIPDESLEKGVETITKILIPQVNYNGVMIQTAQIEVSVGV